MKGSTLLLGGLSEDIDCVLLRGTGGQVVEVIGSTGGDSSASLGGTTVDSWLWVILHQVSDKICFM